MTAQADKPPTALTHLYTLQVQDGTHLLGSKCALISGMLPSYIIPDESGVTRRLGHIKQSV